MTETGLIHTAVSTAAASAIGTAELTQHTSVDMFIVLWVVGGLLTIIALLLAAIGYFIRDMRNSNAIEHKSIVESGAIGLTELKEAHTRMREHNAVEHGELASSHVILSTRLANLEGQHHSAKVCAFEEGRVKEILKELVDETRSS